MLVVANPKVLFALGLTLLRTDTKNSLPADKDTQMLVNVKYNNIYLKSFARFFRCSDSLRFVSIRTHFANHIILLLNLYLILRLYENPHGVILFHGLF